jgi:hypothetical protein
MYTLQIIVSVCIFFPLTSSYTFHLITFATPSHKSAALRLAESAKRVGGFNRSFIYGMDALDPVFRQHNKRILSESRGAGYWIWKPYIILRHLFYEATSAEHVVCYSDALYEFKQNFTQTASKWVEQPPNVAVTVNKPSEKTFFEKAWTKKDAYIIMGVDEASARETLQAWCGFVCVQRSLNAIRFVSEWLTYAQDYRVVSDAPSRLGKEAADFTENRHDQTVCSLLLKKWNATDFLTRAFPDGPLYNHHLHGT